MNIKDFFNDWFIRKPRRLYIKVQRVVEYIPIVWGLYDYDYQSPLNVFKHQLSRVADFMESDRAISMSSYRNAQKIRMVIRLMDKVYDEYYLHEYLDKLDEKYGRPKIMWIPTNDVIHNPISNTMDKSYMMGYNYEGVDENITKEEYETLKSEALYKGVEKHKKAERLLWKIISENIRDWWD